MALLDNTATPIIFLHFPSTLMLLCSTCAFSGGGHAMLINGDYPWTYDNDLFGGPDFWGLMHKHWRMCKLGALQSPINIDPTKLIFDPQLGKLRISQSHVEMASLWNIGQFPLLALDNGTMGSGGDGGGDHQQKNRKKERTDKEELKQKQDRPLLNIAGGPAHPYTYQMQQIVIHFGDVRKGERGSEHTIDRVRFPAELQILAFNSDLYDNFTQAQTQPRGLLAIAIIVDIGDRSNPELHRLTQATKHIKHRNQMVHIKRFHPAGLIPQTEHYVTYDGSMTYPGCFETVTWVVFNAPIYLSIEDLVQWALLVQSEAAESEAKTETGAPPPVSLSSNYRPLKASNGRALRTNINMRLKSVPESGGHCSSRMYVDMGYRTNPARADKVPSLSPSSRQQRESLVETNTKRTAEEQRPKKRITEEEEWMLGMEMDSSRAADRSDRTSTNDSDQRRWAETEEDENDGRRHNLAAINSSVPSIVLDKMPT